jgi:hypothetical protein
MAIRLYIQADIRLHDRYIAFLTGLYTSFGLLVTSLKNRNFDLTLSFFRSLGFGSVSSLTYLNIQLPRGDPVGLIENVLIINSPQLLFSIMYTVAGAIMTTFLVQREFSLMYTRAHRKALRVSEPVGIQRSSYFISLPLRYGIPVNVFSALFHWLISQSYFLARVTALLPDGTEDYAQSFSTLGYSPYAVIVSELNSHPIRLLYPYMSSVCRAHANVHTRVQRA